MKNKRKYILISTASVIAVLLGWYLITDVFKIVNTLLMPSPITVFKAFLTKMVETNPDGATLPQHILASFQLALSGYGLGLVIGIPMGILMAWNRKVEMLIRPLFDLIRPVPPIAWIPVFLLLFGIGMMSKVVIICVSALIPSILNAYTGIKQVNDVHLWVGQTFGASRRQLLFKIAIPSAMPMIFTGLRVALATAWATLVAAEMLAAQRGLGYMIQSNRLLARSDNILVGMLMIGVIGALLTLLLGVIEKRFVKGR